MNKQVLQLVRDNTPTPARKVDSAVHEEIARATVDRLAKQGRSAKDQYVQDTEVPGFRLRKTPTGTLVFLFVGRVRGGEGANKNKLVKRTIGPAKGKGAITVAKARVEAVKLRDALAKGINPADELLAQAEAAEAAKRSREEQKAIKEWTPAYALSDLITERAKQRDIHLHLKPKTVRFYEEGIGYLGKLASIPIVDIKVDAIRIALEGIDGVAKPAKAKRALSGVIAHAIKRLDLNIANPVSRLARGAFRAPPPRAGYVKEADVGEFVDAAIKLPSLTSSKGRMPEAERARDYLLLSLLYGTRKEELMQMEWAWIDWKTGVITFPASATKQKKVHRLPLTPWTRSILERRLAKRRNDDAFVFPGSKKGQPMACIRASVTKAYGEDFKLHDLRRTLATHCASLGINESRQKAILGHARSGVTENYDQREIEQVRRDLTTYQNWVRDQWEAFDHFKHAPPVTAEQAAADYEAEAADMEWQALHHPQLWPGV